MEDLPVDFLGFIFYPLSLRYVGVKNEAEMQKLLFTSKYRTGIFVNSPAEEVMDITGRYKLTHIQLHGGETPDYCLTIREMGVRIIKSFSVHPQFDFKECEEYTGASDFFLFDTKDVLPGGTGKKFNWQTMKKYKLSVPFFLSGGISPGDEEEIKHFRHPCFFGLDLNSGFEDSPGIKNHEKLRTFLEKLNSAIS